MSVQAERPIAYLAMLSLLVGQPVPLSHIPEEFSLDAIWEHVFGLKGNR